MSYQNQDLQIDTKNELFLSKFIDKSNKAKQQLIKFSTHAIETIKEFINNFVGKKPKKDSNSTLHMIFESDYENDNHSITMELALDSNNYSKASLKLYDNKRENFSFLRTEFNLTKEEKLQCTLKLYEFYILLKDDINLENNIYIINFIGNNSEELQVKFHLFEQTSTSNLCINLKIPNDVNYDNLYNSSPKVIFSFINTNEDNFKYFLKFCTKESKPKFTFKSNPKSLEVIIYYLNLLTFYFI